MIDRFHHLVVVPAAFDASLAFYRDVLGWGVKRTWGGPGDRGAMLSGGAMKLVIAERPAGDEAVRPNLHLEIHDVDKRFAALPPGAHVVRAPEATAWGTRWFVVQDPDGNRIAFEEVHGATR